MPFLELIVNPTKRNKENVEQTIHIGNVLGSWTFKESKKRNCISINCFQTKIL